MTQTSLEDLRYLYSVFTELFDDSHLVDKIINHIQEKEPERIRNLLQKCGNEKAVKEFVISWAFEIEHDNTYQLSFLGFIDEFKKSPIFIALRPYYQQVTIQLFKSHQVRVHRFANFVISRLQTNRVKVLDVGCGIGQLSYILARKGMSVTAINIGEEFIQFAKEIQQFVVKRDVSAKNVEFMVCNALDLKRLNETFDAITLSCVIEHISDQERLLDEVCNKVSEGGLIAIYTDNLSRALLTIIVRRLFLLMHFKNPMQYRIAWSGQGSGHIAITSPGYLKKAFRKRGFYTECIYDPVVKGLSILSPLISSGFIIGATKKVPHFTTFRSSLI